MTNIRSYQYSILEVLTEGFEEGALDGYAEDADVWHINEGERENVYRFNIGCDSRSVTLHCEKDHRDMLGVQMCILGNLASKGCALEVVACQYQVCSENTEQNPAIQRVDTNAFR